jgi:tetratricopeptide (TPR) repeat protein
VRLRLGQLQAAIDDYDAALGMQPKLAWSLYGRGLAKKRLARTSEGEADIRAALAIDPDLSKQAGKIGLVDAGAPTPTPPTPMPPTTQAAKPAA